MRAGRTGGKRAPLLAVLLFSTCAFAQTTPAPARARRVVAICPLQVDGDAKAALELDKHLNQTLVQLRIARADAAAVADLLADQPRKRCPEDENDLAQLGRDVGATDVLIVRVGLFPVVAGGRLVASDPTGRTAEIPAVRMDDVKGSRIDAAKQALTGFVRQLPLDDPGILEPLVESGNQTTTDSGTKVGNPQTTTNGSTHPTPVLPPATSPPGKVATSPRSFILGGGASLGLGAAGIVWSVIAHNQFADIDSGVVGPDEAAQLRSLRLQALVGSWGGAALLVVGAASVSYGLLQGQPKRETSVSLTLMPSGVAVLGKF